MPRILSNQFISDLQLKDGLLHPILTLAQRDKTLDLEIRDRYINIYYRGGNLTRIKSKGEDYVATFKFSYLGAEWQKNVPEDLFEKPLNADLVRKWIRNVGNIKQGMDLWFGAHPKDEREFQQLLIRENNFAHTAGGTDYFILDIEYAKQDARFDAVALEWESSGIKRQLRGYEPKLAFIEIKYGDGALSGTSGIKEHIRALDAYLGRGGLEEIQREMIELLRQKRELGLVPGLAKNPNQICNLFPPKKPDFIFLLAGHDPDSRKLRGILDKLKLLPKMEHASLKFAAANFLGWGLYKQNILSLDEFLDRYGRQICARA
jgi:hypothetical protein